MPTTPAHIIDFWLEAGRKSWFAKSEAFDRVIRERFETDHHAAARGELDQWMKSADGALALVLLLDQFPRNLWRNSAHAFATDPLARAVASAAIAVGHDRAVPSRLRSFFYLPFEHSEDLADQQHGVELCEAQERETGESAKWARVHRDIIARFSRFPHRNQCLGRRSTTEELEFLRGGNFGG